MNKLIKEGLLFSVVLVVASWAADAVSQGYGFPITLAVFDAPAPDYLIQQTLLVNFMIAVILGFAIAYFKSMVLKK